MAVLASCGENITLHRAPLYEPVCTFDAYKKCNFSSVSWSEDGKALVSSYDNGRVHVLHYQNNQLKFLQKVNVPDSTVACFMKSTTRCIGVGTNTGKVVIWDCKTNPRKKFEGFSGAVTSIDFNYNDNYGAVSLKTGNVVLFNYSNLRLQKFSVPNEETVNAVRFHSVKKGVLGATTDVGDLIVWDVFSSRELFSKLQAHKAPCLDVAFSSENFALCVSVGYDKTLNCFDIFRGRSESVMSTVTQFPCQSVDFASDGNTVAVGSTRGPVFIYDLRSIDHPVNVINSHSSRVNRVTFQPVLKQNKNVAWSECFHDGQQISEDSNQSGSQESLSFEFPCQFTTSIENESAKSISAGSPALNFPGCSEMFEPKCNGIQQSATNVRSVSPETNGPIRPVCRSPVTKDSPLRVQVLNKALAGSLNSDLRGLHENVRELVTSVQMDIAHSGNPAEESFLNGLPQPSNLQFNSEMSDTNNLKRSITSPTPDDLTSPMFIIPPKPDKAISYGMFQCPLTSTPMIALPAMVSVASIPSEAVTSVHNICSLNTPVTTHSVYTPTCTLTTRMPRLDTTDDNNSSCTGLPTARPVSRLSNSPPKGDGFNEAEHNFMYSAKDNRGACGDGPVTSRSVAVQADPGITYEDYLAEMRAMMRQCVSDMHVIITKQAIITQDYILDAVDQRMAVLDERMRALQSRMNQLAHGSNKASSKSPYKTGQRRFK